MFTTLVYGILQFEPGYAPLFPRAGGALGCLAIPVIGASYRKLADTCHESRDVS